MQDGASLPSDVPLVAGRPAFLRVYHQTDAAYDGLPVQAHLQLADGSELQGEIGQLAPQVIEEDVGTGAGFVLTGDQVGSELGYTVSLLQQGSPETDNPAAHWSETVAVAGHKNTLRIVVVPYRYDADGSGRLPNTSPEQMQVFKDRFLGMYPVSNVEITVHEPVPWNSAISPDGTGWQGVGLNLFSLKNSENLGADVYYYGMFNPADNLFAYCGGGCLLGVTLLNNDPPETGTVGLRLALGVGFDAEAPNTCAHEIGHAHGRGHVNCGFGVAPDSVDPGYPHAANTIGGWSWDVVSNTLVDPGHTDIMGYCDNQWISDYNFGKLFTRTQNVNLEDFVLTSGIAYDVIAFDGLGAATWLTDVSRARPIAGEKLALSAINRTGERQMLDAVFVPYDHLAGGWLFLPAGEATEVELPLAVGSSSTKRPR